MVSLLIDIPDVNLENQGANWFIAGSRITKTNREFF
jgi:hypothetical protein